VAKIHSNVRQWSNFSENTVYNCSKNTVSIHCTVLIQKIMFMGCSKNTVYDTVVNIVVIHSTVVLNRSKSLVLGRQQIHGTVATVHFDSHN
jgi:hypothetical protein